MSARTVTRLAASAVRRWYGRTMISRATVGLAFALLGGCATWHELPASEKAWQALHLVDVAQTLNGPAGDPCYFEERSVRHLIGEKPEPAAVVAWGVGLALLHYAGSRVLERAELPEWSKTALRAVDLGYKGLTVSRNFSRGVRPFGGNDCPWR